MISNEYVNRAIEYILSHIDEEISVDRVAAHCNFSKHYFSRMFKAATGESIGGFIMRLKMEQSAFRLKVERSRSITDIGGDYGYSASNYSSAFKQYHDVSPMQFRGGILAQSLRNPIFQDADVRLEDFARCDEKITIEVFADRTAVYHRHKGSYENLSRHWGEFQAMYGDWITEETLFLERTYDDPSITAAGECLYDLYMTVPESCALPNICRIPGGKYAVYHFYGPVQQIYAAYQSLFNIWIPQSGYAIDERYSFDICRRIDGDTSHMQIDICIPIA